MLFKRIIISLFLIPSFLLGIVPVTASANTNLSEQHRLELLKQIQRLLDQVRVLQKQLEAKQFHSLVSGSIVKNRIPYESQFYIFPHEAIYFVVDGKLINSDSKRKVGDTAQKTFDLFTAVVGEKAVKNSVDEWRVFNNQKSDIGAYVELMETTEEGPRDWVVGVNREGFDAESTKSFANLFVHEYGHILFYDKPTFEERYKNSFWTTADAKHGEEVSKAMSDEKFSLTQDYYEENSKRFVSDYATVSFGEDMAETFVYFIREDKPISNSVRNQKILAFYQEPDLVEIRTQIRANLRDLGVL